jgi:hypothetical protein
MAPLPLDGAIRALTAATHLDHPDNGCLAVDAATFGTRAATGERRIALDRVLPAKGVAAGLPHPGAQLVKGLARHLVPAETNIGCIRDK